MLKYTVFDSEIIVTRFFIFSFLELFCVVLSVFCVFVFLLFYAWALSFKL